MGKLELRKRARKTCGGAGEKQGHRPLFSRSHASYFRDLFLISFSFFRAIPNISEPGTGYVRDEQGGVLSNF